MNSAKAEKVMSVGKARKDDMSIAKADKEPAMSVEAKAFKEDNMSVAKSDKEPAMSVGKAGKVFSVGKASKT